VLSGAAQLPTDDAMRQNVAEHRAWKRSWMPDTAKRASSVLLHQVHYHDALFKDMDLPHRRQGNPVSELFWPYAPADYRGITPPVEEDSSLPGQARLMAATEAAQGGVSTVVLGANGRAGSAAVRPAAGAEALGETVEARAQAGSAPAPASAAREHAGVDLAAVVVAHAATQGSSPEVGSAEVHAVA
jgi:hypothetical protein